MTNFVLQGRHLAYWEDRLRKESLAVSMHHGAPYHDQREMHGFLVDRELGPLARGNWTMHRTKSRASLAWQDYAHGKNTVTGYNTRYRHDGNLPFFPPRSAEARRPATSETTNAFPAEPRMRGALEAARSISLRREMLRPQTVQPHKTDMRSSADCETQAPSPAPLGLAQFDRDLAARREEGLRVRRANGPCTCTAYARHIRGVYTASTSPGI